MWHLSNKRTKKKCFQSKNIICTRQTSPALVLAQQMYNILFEYCTVGIDFAENFGILDVLGCTDTNFWK